MRCAMVIAGFTAGEADLLRRAMGSKRSVEAMAGLKERFVTGGRTRGYADMVIETVWTMIQGFALYGFPESHAIAFAFLIAVSGYLKRYYPAQFLCALLNSQPMGFYSPAMLISDSERHNVIILPPDIRAAATIIAWSAPKWAHGRCDWGCGSSLASVRRRRHGLRRNRGAGRMPIYLT